MLVISLLPVGSALAMLIIWLILVACAATAGLGPFRLSRGAVVALPFALAAFPLIFTVQEQIITTVSIGPLDLTISAEGLRRFLTIMAGSWLSVQVALLLAFTTPFHDLIDALRELRLPRILVSIISFMYRYMAVLTDEGSRMLRARDSRSALGAGRGGGSIRWRATVTGRMVGSLFLRAYERSERIYAAMQARGFEGEFRHLRTRALARVEIVWLALVLALFAVYEVI
ncbi:MAG: cobalt ECF transporter T component CbiQ, partial [Chloroflexi bacterium]|nr:cobalt ECF transporter T component CbiQ [Chloroflexota bacterium]